MTGQKFNDNQKTLKHIREYSDGVCLAFGIQPIIPNKGVCRNIKYNEWEHKRKGTSWKDKIRLEIDRLIGSVKNLDELLNELESMEYEIKRGKYISVKAPGQQRFVRTKTLGEDYTEESLISRIRWRDVGASISVSGENAPIRNDYIHTINDVTDLARSGRKVQRRRFASEPYSPENDVDVYKLSAQLSIINRDNIYSIGELEGKIQRLKSEYENARQEVNSLVMKQERLDWLIEQAEAYFDLIDRPDLSASEKLRLKICRQTLESNNISDCADYDRLKAVQQETDKKISALKNSFENCRKLYEVYADIDETYHNISKGDYISNLISEKKRAKERKKSAPKKSRVR